MKQHSFEFSVCHAGKQKLKILAKSIKTIKSIIIISIFIMYLSVAH